MKLRYHLSQNFGDALNPYIFKHFLPDFFDEDNDIEFIGIGSIIGFKTTQQAKKKIICSSGFAYGSIPEIDKSYDIKCVRGPRTANILNIDKKYAVADGAILLQYMPINGPSPKKKYKFSYMPHWESALKYDWEKLCESAGIHYLNPRANYIETIEEIKNSEIIIAEAMHAAIVADALRVPWIPVKSYAGINDFKWQDWLESFGLTYTPCRLPSLYNNTSFTKRIIKEKTGYPLNRSTLSPILKIYEIGQKLFKEQKVLNLFEEIKKKEPCLSPDRLLKEKGALLLDKLAEIKVDYSR